MYFQPQGAPGLYTTDLLPGTQLALANQKDPLWPWDVLTVGLKVGYIYQLVCGALLPC